MEEDTPSVVEQPLLDPGGTNHERKGSKGSFSMNDDLHVGFQAALSAIESRKTGEESSWKPVASTARLVQRQVAMKLCGWCLKEDELSAAILRLVDLLELLSVYR